MRSTTLRLWIELRRRTINVATEAREGEELDRELESMENIGSKNHERRSNTWKD